MRKLSVIVGLVIFSIFAAAAAGASSSRVNPVKVTARVTPKHRSRPPYTWTTTGTVVAPPRGKPKCPPGTKDKHYCTKPPPPKKCDGNVTLTVRLQGKDKRVRYRGRKIGFFRSRTKHCAYRFHNHFKTSIFTTTHRGKRGRTPSVGVYFFVRFLGNSDLKPKNAKTQIVIARLVYKKAPSKHHKHKKH